MALDTATLRVAFGVVALSMLVLFYFVTYRSTRSAYCGWWCVALGLFLLGSAAYLLDGTDQQWWANPTGSTLLVLGTSCVWAGARSLRARRVRVVPLLAAPSCTAVAAALDDPATNEWAGGAVFLALMSLTIALASRELWLVRPSASDLVRLGSTYRPVLHSMAAMAGAFALFYLFRTIAFVVSGQDGRLFDVYAGSEVTTLFTTVLLAAVSFSMTSLSHARETEELRDHATRDGLTGLLNRTEFVHLASAEWLRRGGARGSLVLADVDDFKDVNDTYGHAAGDFALQAFAATCRGVVGSSDLVGRYGGDEFVLFLPGASATEAEQLVARISERLRAVESPTDAARATVSFGIAAEVDGVTLEEAIALADRALYEAKALGRDRIVVVG